MFKVNNKNVSSVFIVEIEQLNDGWDILYHLFYDTSHNHLLFFYLWHFLVPKS